MRSMRSVIAGIIAPLGMVALAGAQPSGDHLECYKVKDPLARTSYRADLAGLALEPDCIIQMPAKMVCVPATKTNVRPAPPGGGGIGTPNSFFCYKAKCRKAAPAPLTATDQFGSRTVMVSTTKLVCAPIGDDTSSPCGTATPPEGTLDSTCTLPFPPTSAIPCSIVTPGKQYYVNAATGNDANSGASPSQPWQTLCRAVGGAAPGSTIRVAAGTYLDGNIAIEKALTVKGGYDATFADWDPVGHPTYFHGKLTLSDDAAVWGGFRMTSRPASSEWCDGMHHVTAGTLVGNYVEIVYTSLRDDTQCAQLIDVQPAGGHSATLACNDIYVRGKSPQHLLGTTAVELYALGGAVMLDSNRVCLDGYPNTWFAETVSGYGTCGGTSVSQLTLANNVIENAASGYAVGSFYGCGHDLDMVLTNNTVLTNGAGITGYAGESGGQVRWKLTNNIVARSPSGSGSGVQLGTDPGVVVTSAAGNLVFGFADNAITPTPQTASQNDTGGAWTPNQVFVGPPIGDYRLRAGSPGIGTGINVYGLPAYGSVIDDLLQQPRPASGSWDRGALKY
jgi:Protein of unknown function (DUF1565)